MMQNIQAQSPNNLSFDLKDAVTENRLAGLWRLMKGYRAFYVGAVLSMALGASARTFNYLVLAYVIDTVIAQGIHADRLPWYGLAFVGLAAFEGLMSYLRGIWSARTAEGITQRLRDYLFDHVQRLPFAYHDHAKTGELIQRATSDMDTLRRFYADQAVGIGRIVALFGVNTAGADYALDCGDEGKRFKMMPCETAGGLIVFVESDELAWDRSGQVASVSTRRPLYTHRSLTNDQPGLRAP